MQEDSSPKVSIISGIHSAIESSADNIPTIPIGDLIELWVSILSMEFQSKVKSYSCLGKEDKEIPGVIKKKQGQPSKAKPLTVAYEYHNDDQSEEDNRTTVQHILRQLGDHCSLYHQRYFTAEDVEGLKASKQLLKDDQTGLWNYRHGLPQSVLCSETNILGNVNNASKRQSEFYHQIIEKNIFKEYF